MASEILSIHHKTPELRKIERVIEFLEKGAVILYPTDTGFTLGCSLANKEGIHRIRTIRKIPESKSLTFLCDSLSNVSEFAKVTNVAYRTIKSLVPGPYTFILPASKQVPKFAQDPKKKTTGIRVPDNILSQLLLKKLAAPVISITAKIDDVIINDPDELVDTFAPFVDIAVKSDEYNFCGESTIIDMTTDEFKVLRHGAGITRVLEYIDYEQD